MNAIEINNLYWKYDGSDKYTFQDLNLLVKENIFLGVIGSNESGKTTLASCMKGIIPNSSNGIFKGKIKIFDQDIKNCDSRIISEKIGMVFSDPDSQFTSMSVEEEIAFGLENIGIDEEEIKNRIKWVSELTYIEELLEKPPYDLSGGQKQRVAIAAVLAMKPKIIILDEPTSMLDPKSKDQIFELLEIIKNQLNMTIIVIEHNIEKVAELSDEVILLNDGKIIKHEETKKFFEDINLLKENGLKVPESIELLYYLYDKHGITKQAPVKFNEITKEIEKLIGGNKI